MAWKVIIPLVERMLSSAGEVTFHLRKENRLLQDMGGRGGWFALFSTYNYAANTPLLSIVVPSNVFYLSHIVGC